MNHYLRVNVKINAIILFKVLKRCRNVNPKVSKTSNTIIMLLSKCAICNSKKSRFVKEQEVSGALNKLGIKTTLSKIPLLGDILF